MEIKKKRIRSPNFPFIDLEKAVDLVKEIHNGYDRHPVPIEVVGKAIQVSAGSYLAQHISAFSQYGLINIEGEKEGRKINVSDLAFKIIIDDRHSSPDRDRLLRDAALNPTMFSIIHKRYPNGLPPDTAGLEYELKVEYGFNPKSVNDFIRVFKLTMEFTKIYYSGKMVENNINTKEPEMNIRSSNPIVDEKKLQYQEQINAITEQEKSKIYNYNKEIEESFNIILKGNKKAVLSFSSLPIQKADINLIKKYIDLMAENWAPDILDDEKQN
jgi:hypothetical protein